MGKVLIDLRNTREEAICVADPKFTEDEALFLPTKDVEHQQKIQVRNEDGRRSSTTSEKSMDQEDEDDRETKYRLDPKCVHVFSDYCDIKFVLISIQFLLFLYTSFQVCKCEDTRPTCPHKALFHIGTPEHFCTLFLSSFWKSKC